MKDLRALLLDCRSALRRADPGFESSPLRRRLEDAILDLGKPPEPKPDATPEVPVPETYAAQQVAFAWQVAARDLRFTHPDLHVQLGDRVRKLLDAEVLDDPAFEIQRLQSAASAAQAAAASARADLEELRQALADAVPGIDDKVPPAEATRLRMRKLIDVGSRVGAVPATVHRTPAEPDEIAPSREALREVAAGQRSLTRGEREWCVSEAMVLLGFQRTPVQLLADGEPALARIILDASH